MKKLDLTLVSGRCHLFNTMFQSFDIGRAERLRDKLGASYLLIKTENKNRPFVIVSLSPCNLIIDNNGNSWLNIDPNSKICNCIADGLFIRRRASNMDAVNNLLAGRSISEDDILLLNVQKQISSVYISLDNIMSAYEKSLSSSRP